MTKELTDREKLQNKVSLIIHRANEKSLIPEEDRLSVPEAMGMIMELVDEAEREGRLDEIARYERRKWSGNPLEWDDFKYMNTRIAQLKAQKEVSDA